MKQLIVTILIAFSLTGCAATVRGKATQIVVASDSFADEVADGWSEYVDFKIADCKSKLPPSSTPDQRRDCMGLAAEGDRLEAALASLVAAQRAVQIAIQCESNPAKVPAQFLGECVTGAVVDWGKLFVDVQRAWSEVRPFFEAMKGAKQ